MTRPFQSLPWRLGRLGVLAVGLGLGCPAGSSFSAAAATPTVGTSAAVGFDPLRLVASARRQIGATLEYDPAYRRLAYPGGDVPLRTGVCSDVVVRALRDQGLDLQQAVHEDMKRAFREYPQRWGLKKPDPNIDHRRVPNLMTYFLRRGWSLGGRRPGPGPVAGQGSGDAAAFAPGDIVAWDLGGGVTHIGILGDRRAAGGHPLVIHNIGAGACEEDLLRRHRILGHYRVPAQRPASGRGVGSVPGAGSRAGVVRP